MFLYLKNIFFRDIIRGLEKNKHYGTFTRLTIRNAYLFRAFSALCLGLRENF